MPTRPDLRNVAIVAHVDHGKTTLVDAMLWQSGAFSERDTVEKTGERVMDSGDLEREKGITILAKNTAVHYRGPAAQALGLEDGVTINVIDTPGHADFGGEVERGLSMVDGVVLMVDASEGPLPQTRFVLRKALQAHLPVIVVVNKVDRPDSRIDEVVSETTDLLLSLGEDLMNEGIDIDVDSLMDVPVVYASAKAGKCSLDNPGDGQLPTEDLEPLFETILNRIPGPSFDEDMPLQAHVTNLDASPFLGRLALLRIHNGTLKKGADVGLARHDGTIQRVHISELLATEGLERVSTESAAPGDIVAVAGIEDIMIGESLVDLEDPRPLPLITVDDPAISMTIGINTSPMAGRVKGAKVTARQVKDRLDRELIGNVSLKVLPTERPDAWEVQGRGELALAILVEQMRREGYELQVGKPEVVYKTINGQLCEPIENLTVEVPQEYMGAVMEGLGMRKAELSNMEETAGYMRLEFTIPARGLIGFRSELLTSTKGNGIMNHVFHGYAPYKGDIPGRTRGSLVAFEQGETTGYGIYTLQDRGTMFISPGEQVYEGMIVGENSRENDIDINPCKKKNVSNMRTSSSDEAIRLTPPRILSLEQAIEYINNDELVEVTPQNIRLRKSILDRTVRGRAAKNARK